MDRPITTLALSCSKEAKQLLKKSGFERAGDVLSAQPSELAQITRMDTDKISELMREIEELCSEKADVLRPRTLSELIEERSRDPRLTTMSRNLDSLFGNSTNGLPIREVVELVGAPGCGKTQVCMQLACSVCIPSEKGGPEGSCFYVDTEGSFDSARCSQMADSLRGTLEDRDLNVLSNVDVFRVLDVGSLTTLIKSWASSTTPLRSSSSAEVKLIVVDSVAFPFRGTSISESVDRSRVLNQLMQCFNRLARRGACVVLVNHATTSFDENLDDSKLLKLKPALGESWGHAVTHRIWLEKTCRKTTWSLKNSNSPKQITAVRTASLVKSPGCAKVSKEFVVVQEGVRDPARTRKRPHAD